jgi:D-3-phosphoglycerate dehydrogenase
VVIVSPSARETAAGPIQPRRRCADRRAPIAVRRSPCADRRAARAVGVSPLSPDCRALGARTYPGHMAKALLLENIHPVAVENLEASGFEVDLRKASMSEDELVAALPGVTLLGIRSNTHITPRVLDAAPDLTAIGCFCIGTNQVDLGAAAERGVVVFNAPYSNTRSVVELVIAEIISLARRLPEKTQKMHAGIWDKSAKGSHEVRGRTLGIVGYGNIGTQLSNLAEAMGMYVIFYDIADRLAHGNARRLPTMDALLAEADVVSLHVDGRPGNAGIFGDEQFKKMKPRSLFINAARGMVVDTEALREHILSGHIAGAALDVFPIEPKAQGDEFESPLRGLDNVILTPHVGGSTQEAQEEIGYFVSTKLKAFEREGSTALSVNLPAVQPPELTEGARLGYLHVNVPGVLAEVNNILATEGVNVSGQYLATRGEQGYVVTDVSGHVSEGALAKLQASPHTQWLKSWEA